MKDKRIHKPRQVQVRDLIEPQKPDWYREDIHGFGALAQRQANRLRGLMNTAKRGSRCGFKDWQRWRARL